MLMPFGALIGLAGSLLGSELQHQKNRENFDYMQQVNSPAAQIARFRQAGINPAMMMLNPSVSSGNATSPPDSPDYAAHINNGINAALSAMQMRNLASQNRNLDEDIKGKRIANDVARVVGEAEKAEAREREKASLANTKYLDSFRVPKPDEEHDWKLDDSGFWYYIDEDGVRQKDVRDFTGFPSNRDVLAHVEYNKKLDEAETTRFNKIYSEYRGKREVIKETLDEQFGYDLTNAQYSVLLKTISEIEARTDLTNAQKFQLEMDNEIWSQLGVEGRAIAKVLQFLLRFKP